MSPSFHNADRALLGFVSLSAALHLAVLACWGRPSPLHLLGDTLLSIRLEQPAVHSSPASKPVVKQRIQKRTSRSEPAHNIQGNKGRTASQRPALAPINEIPRAKAVPDPATVAQTVTSTPRPVHSSRSAPTASATAPDHRLANPSPPEDAGPRILAQLRLDLARHFSYPPLARRRGWQGEVILALRVEADGRISNTRVARSSGYGALDRAALESLRRLPPLETAAHLLNGRRLDLQLPVIYRLKEG